MSDKSKLERMVDDIQSQMPELSGGPYSYSLSQILRPHAKMHDKLVDALQGMVNLYRQNPNDYALDNYLKACRVLTRAKENK